MSINVAILGINAFGTFNLGNCNNLPVEFHFGPVLASFLFVPSLQSLAVPCGSLYRRTGAKSGYPKARCLVEDFQVLRCGVARTNQYLTKCGRRDNNDVPVFIFYPRLRSGVEA